MSTHPKATLLDGLEWVEVSGVPDQLHADDLYVTHEGTLTIGDSKLRCYTLNDGQRVFDADDVEKFFTGAGE